MKTNSKDKIEKAALLMNLISQRRDIEKQEIELKEYFKGEIKDGILEAGSIVILIERKSRSMIDKKLMEQELGIEQTKHFEKITEYDQVTVKAKA